MWRDFEDWGSAETVYVATFARDRYAGPPDCEGIAEFLKPENYISETRYILIRDEIVGDTTDIDFATRFYQPHEATRAILLHRAECGDIGRIYEITAI